MSNESAMSNLAYGIPSSIADIAGMTINRLTALNMMYLIKETILPINGYVSRMSETLTPAGQTEHPDTGETVTAYQATGSDFVYYNPDPSNPALTGLLTDPIVSAPQGLSYIDHQNGTIYYSGVTTNTIDVEYDYYTVYVQMGFPDWGADVKNWEDIRLPLVAIDFSSRKNNQFALGGAFEELRNFVINITANSDPQKSDLMDIIETSLRYTYAMTINYNYGFPVDFKGEKNPNFDRGPGSRWKEIRFKEQSSKVIRDPLLPEKLRHQGNVYIQIQIV